MGNLKSLPCPFCNSDAELNYEMYSLEDWSVKCTLCGAETCPDELRENEQDAIDDWNTRCILGHEVKFRWIENETESGWQATEGSNVYGPTPNWESLVTQIILGAI